jgi:glycosyltransferase involved in cell wall biosynthesis
MPQPLVNVVVPVYNGANYLRKALDSALGQSYQPLQVIVVDDGSTDSSADIITSYGIRLLAIRQANGGVALARNAGIRACRGEFIAFLDQDDWWLPEKIEKQVEKFRADKNLGLVHTDVLQYGDAVARFVDPVYPTDTTPLLQGRCYQRLILDNGVFNSSVMIRRSVLGRSGMFDPAMPGNTVQDYDLWLRIAQHFPFGYVAEKLTVLRLHDNQGTWDRRAMLTDELGLLERTLGHNELRASTAMRTRLARLLGALGVAHLDAGSSRSARPHFARALGLRRSWRLAALYALSFLPVRWTNWLRQRRARRRGTSPAAQPLQPVYGR